MNNILKIITGTLLLMLLVACSGGSSGGDNANPGTPIVSNTLFPIDPSYTWYYNSDSTGVYFTDPRNIAGYQSFPLVHPTGAREYFATDASSVYYLGVFIPTIIVSGAGTFQADTTLSAPITFYSDQWAPGHSQSISGTGTANISPTYGSRPTSYTGSVLYIGVESVTVGTGTYNAHHVSINFTASATVSGLTISIPFSTELWLAEGFGIVKRNESGTIFDLTSVDNLPAM